MSPPPRQPAPAKYRPARTQHLSKSPLTKKKNPRVLVGTENTTPPRAPRARPPFLHSERILGPTSTERFGTNTTFHFPRPCAITTFANKTHTHRTTENGVVTQEEGAGWERKRSDVRERSEKGRLYSSQHGAAPHHAWTNFVFSCSHRVIVLLARGSSSHDIIKQAPDTRAQIRDLGRILVSRGLGLFVH